MTRRTLGLALVLPFLLGACAADPDDVEQTEQDITGSYDYPASSFPYAVWLTGVGPDRRSGCSAVSIAPHWLVTAGHCAAPGNEIMIGFATPNVSTSTPATFYTVANYASGGPYDLALVHMKYRTGLPGVAIFNDAAPTLPWLQPGAQTTVVGYGWGDNPNTDPILDCSQAPALGVKHAGVFNLSASGGMGIAVSPQYAICAGDSGGPWLWGNYLIGVSSWSNLRPGTTAGAALLKPSLEWMLAAMKLVDPNTTCTFSGVILFGRSWSWYSCTDNGG